jgi:hypothetical protein
MEFMDLLCHEYHHLKLFRVQEFFPMTQPSDIQVATPWRTDKRSIDGLFHGIYVFAMCARLLRRMDETLELQRKGLRREVVFRVCVEKAIADIRAQDALLLPRGDKLCSAIANENATQLAYLAARPMDGADLQREIDWARKKVSEHLASVERKERTQPWYLAA